MLTIKKLPEKMSEIKVDMRHPNRALIHGCFVETVKSGEQKKNFLTYIPEEIEYARPCIVVAPPSSVDPLEFLESSGLVRLADENKLYLAVLNAPQNGWSTSPEDVNFMNAVYEAVQKRDYYVTIQDNIYACGVGDGAMVAHLAAAEMSSDWSGLVSFGDLEIPSDRFSSGEKKKYDQGEQELMIDGQKAQIPVWMMVGRLNENNEKAVKYWKEQNHVTDQPLCGQGADYIWMPEPVRYLSEINEEVIAQVRVTEHAGSISYERLVQVWDYIGTIRRHRSFGIKNLRYVKDPVKAGAVYHTMELNGMTRRWYEYVPEGCTPDKKWPLVVVMHGRGGSAETFFDISCMSPVAHDRKFIAVFPEASFYQQKKDGLKNVLAWNGIYEGEPFDDVSFIRCMIEEISKRLPVDRKRIYACGQSSGGMMADILGTCASDLFAACASWSGLMIRSRMHRDFAPTEAITPTMFIYGDHDKLCISEEPNPDLPLQLKDEFCQVLLEKMKRYHLKKENFTTWKAYPITWYCWPDEKGVPMLTVGVVENMVHANYPEESRISYDEFFCQFSKKEDGGLSYRGQ